MPGWRWKLLHFRGFWQGKSAGRDAPAGVSSSFIQGDQLAQIAFGTKVANAVAGKTVPQNATGTIFTVSGGRILVTAEGKKELAVVDPKSARVTVRGAADSSASTRAASAPALGRGWVCCSRSRASPCSALTITAAEAGALFSLPTAVGSALNGSVAKSGSVTLGGGQVVATGTIGQNVSAADATGAIRWTLFYVPLDSGASVVTA